MKSWTFAASASASASAFASAAAALLACGHAAAHFKSPDDAIEYRQGALAVMDNHFGRLGAMASGKTPFDAHAAQANAELVVTLARLPWSAFVDGSDKGDTNARPEVCSQADKFKAACSAIAETCKSCHDDFRKKHLPGTAPLRARMI
jgi:cytochrome c556